MDTEVKTAAGPGVKTEPIVTSQPAPAQPMLQKYREQTGTEEWQHDKWDCFKGEDNLCLKATFCPCFVYGKTEARRRDPTLAGYERFNQDCLIWGGAQYCGLGWVLNFIRRGEMRADYNIRGDVLKDCLFSWCCHCCALIQQEKEVIGRQAMAGMNTAGYMPPQAMNNGGPH